MRMHKPLSLLGLLLVIALLLWQRHPHSPGVPMQAPPTAGARADAGTSAASLPAFLPPEARATLALIARGGPFPHRQDGVVFGNYEGLLPKQPRGYYHEYTVETPGARTRGARRIITGGTPPAVCYYTEDHYRSFRRFACQS